MEEEEVGVIARVVAQSRHHHSLNSLPPLALPAPVLSSLAFPVDFLTAPAGYIADPVKKRRYEGGKGKGQDRSGVRSFIRGILPLSPN